MNRHFKVLIRFLAATTCVALTWVVSACTDSSGHPLAVVMAPEVHGAVALDNGMGILPQILAAHDLERSLAPEMEAWQRSWELGSTEGAALRDTLYPLVSQRLFSRLGKAGTEDLLGRASLTLTVAQGLDPLISDGPLGDALSRARTLHNEARRALLEEDPERALEWVLRATDLMYELSPERVATDLIQRAEDQWGRIQGDPSYSEKELTRIRRLMYGASEALKVQDYPGAIRRAYYACQLLGAGPI